MFDAQPQISPQPPAITLYADGGTIGGSPGRGIYWTVESDRGTTIRKQDLTGKRRRSDEAEYHALVEALHHLLRIARPGDVAVIFTDSHHVLHHVRRRLRPRSPRLVELYWETILTLRELAEREITVILGWCPRQVIRGRLGH